MLICGDFNTAHQPIDLARPAQNQKTSGFLPEERDFKFKDQLESELSVAFGGRVAEEIVFDRISTGASNDIKQATDLAQKMVTTWGMSETLGPLSYAKGEEQVFLGREIAQHRDYSEATAQKIDSEVNRLIETAYDRAKSVLQENLDVLHRLADLLLETETVMGKELDELIHEMRPGIELPSHSDSDEEAAAGAEDKNESDSGNAGGAGKEEPAPDPGEEPSTDS